MIRESVRERPFHRCIVRLRTDDLWPNAGCDNRLGGGETAAMRGRGEARREGGGRGQEAGGGKGGQASGGEAGSW